MISIKNEAPRGYLRPLLCLVFINHHRNVTNKLAWFFIGDLNGGPILKNWQFAEHLVHPHKFHEILLSWVVYSYPVIHLYGS